MLINFLIKCKRKKVSSYFRSFPLISEIRNLVDITQINNDPFALFTSSTFSDIEHHTCLRFSTKASEEEIHNEADLIA